MTNAAPTTALAPATPHERQPFATNPAAITASLKKAEAEAHLVSPATSVQMIPEGCGVAITTVRVNAEKEAGEVYDVGGGKFGLGKAALDRIAMAAGISWDPRQSRRLDDASDPNYVMFLAVGRYRTFDGVTVEIMGTKEMDLRPGSPQCQAIQARARDGESRDKQIREMRLHILGHAESKARLRAIRSIGIKTSYTRDELAKPFVVARLMWTGQTNDPELRRAFAMKQADAMLGGTAALYGSTPSAPQLHAPASAPPVRPPPVGSVAVAPEDLEPPSDPAPAKAAAAPGEWVVPFGNNKGKPVSQLGDGDLDWLAGHFEKSINDPSKAKYAGKAKKDLAAVQAEIARRKAPAPAATQQQTAPAPESNGDEEYDRGPNADDY